MDACVDRVAIVVLVGVAELSWGVALLLTEFKVVEHLLQLKHEVVIDCLLAHLCLLALRWHVPVENQVSELVDHEELLKNGVHVARGSQVPEAHVLGPDLTLLGRQDAAHHITHVGHQGLVVNSDDDVVDDGPALFREGPLKKVSHSLLEGIVTDQILIFGQQRPENLQVAKKRSILSLVDIFLVLADTVESIGEDSLHVDAVCLRYYHA